MKKPSLQKLSLLAESLMIADLGDDWHRDPSRKRGRALVAYFDQTYGMDWWQPYLRNGLLAALQEAT